MKIEVILTESEIAEEFRASLEARDLPEKFFYWSPGAVAAWRVLSRNSDYEGLRQAWRDVAARLSARIAHFGHAAPLISYGSGDGTQDLVLLQSLADTGREPAYFPVDASQTLLEMACAAGEDADIDTTGIKADISVPPHLIYASDAADAPRLFLMTGGTLGGFDPLEQLRHLAQNIHEGDLLLVDGEICREDSLARRRKPSVLHFAAAPLAMAGVTSEDGEIRFEQKRDERRGGLTQFTSHFHASRDVHITPAGVDIARGERIALTLQYAYTPDAFRWLLTTHAGLKIVEESISTDGRFLAAVCSR